MQTEYGMLRGTVGVLIGKLPELRRRRYEMGRLFAEPSKKDFGGLMARALKRPTQKHWSASDVRVALRPARTRFKSLSNPELEKLVVHIEDPSQHTCSPQEICGAVSAVEAPRDHLKCAS